MKLIPLPLLRGLASLAEGPCWHPGEEALYFTDIPSGKIWRFDPASGEAQIFHEGQITGGLTLQLNGEWLLFRENDLAWLDSEGRLKQSIPVHLSATVRFNDVIADPAGRVFAGTIGSDEKSGGLYRFDNDGIYRCLFQGTRIANGLAFAPGNRHLYWTCTTSRCIYRFDYHGETGDLSNRHCFYECAPAEGWPDGLTIDAEGCLWSARWGSGLVVLISPQGEKVGQIEFTESNITSIAWGGAKLQDLYVTAARTEGKPGMHDLFVIPNAGRGLPEYRANLSLESFKTRCPAIKKSPIPLFSCRGTNE